MKDQVKQIIRELFESGEIDINVRVAPVCAKYGDGQWNQVEINVSMNGEIIYENTGDVDLID